MEHIGARYSGNESCTFYVWAPEKTRMTLHLVHPVERKIEMQKTSRDYFTVEVKDIKPGTRYFLQPNGETDYPDPASHFQPEGVHGPSEVVDHNRFRWQDSNWKGIPFNELILYELHIGTFTNEGTFEAVISFLDEIADTGINGLEIMPVAQFPGNRNWGYDSVFPYAVQNSYGGPEGLKKLVNACHQKGIAVFLDVIYNHLGPEGNYLSKFGPYFTEKYKTPWGEAINFDDKWSDGVRDYFAGNAVYWFENYHIDGVRIDAVHEVYDSGAVNFWEFMHGKIKPHEQQTGKTFNTIAESNLNDPKIVKPPEVGGRGFTAQWLDDFHHALYVLLDKNGKEHYSDFGTMDQLAKAYTDGFVLSGEYVDFRKKKYGKSSAGIPGNQFVVFIQNHDQIGNRAMAERLSLLTGFEQLKLAAAGILLSPYIPLLFMGEEYGEENPFFYFISHSDENLIKAVQKGRLEEFRDFEWKAEPPDPQDEKIFNRSKLNWQKRYSGKHAILLNWYKKLIALRQSTAIFQNFNKNDIRVTTIGQEGFILQRQNTDGLQHLIVIINLSEKEISCSIPYKDYQWEKILDSKDEEWLEANNSILPKLPERVKSNEHIHMNPHHVVVYVSCE